MRNKIGTGIYDIDHAWKMFEKGDYEASMKIFCKLYEAKEDNDSLYGYACALLRSGDTELATEMFDRLVEKDKNNFKAFHTRALAHGMDENYQLALKDLQRAAELAIEKQEVWCDLGGTYLVMKNYREAAQFFQKAVDNDGRCYEAWMGKALSAYFNKEHKAALEFLNISIKLNPKNLLALLAKVEVLLEMGKTDEVDKELKKIMAIDPDIFNKSLTRDNEEDDEEDDDFEIDEDGNRSEEDEIEEFDLDD